MTLLKSNFGFNRKLIVAAAFSGALLFPISPAMADGLIENVNGITLDQEGEVLRFNGLLIDKDGKVSKLITKKNQIPKQLDFTYDGKGQTLLPGLIDAHGHVSGLGFQALTLDLSQTNSLEEAKAAIKAYAEEFSGRRWIIGRGWNQEKWGLGRFPNAADLEGISDRPIWLERVDGHAGWANNIAMEIADLPDDVQSPSGGRIEKIDGKPSGIFVDTAAQLIQKHVPKPSAKDYDLALSKAQEILLSQGITAMADMGTTLDEWQSYRRAGDLGRLNVRIFSYAGGIENMTIIGGPAPTPWLYDGRLKMLGVKLYLDGALGSRGAWLKEDYHDASGQRGLPILSFAELRNKMVRASMDGFQTAVHAIGDAANAEAISSIEDISDIFDGDRRWRIEHAQVVDPTDLPRLANHGIISSMQPVHQTSDRLMAEARLGPNRLEGAYAWQSILKAGGRLALGSDTPVESSNPFAGLAVSITREDSEGQPFGGWIASEKLTREQALAGFTTGAAYASFAEENVGSLTPGHYADFILVDVDPLLSSTRDLRNTIVSETWVAGKPVFVKDQ